MRTRKMRYEDYGLGPDDARQIKQHCKDMQFDDYETLLRAAWDARVEIAPELFYSLARGLSYNALSRIYYIPIPQVDFYGWQRRCVSLYKQYLDAGKENAECDI